MNKTVKFEIGIEGDIPDSIDGVFNADIELTDDEYRQVLEAHDKLMWDQDDFAELQDWIPEALLARLCSAAEPFAVAKYGDNGKQDKGASYTFYTPDEILNEYDESDEMKAFLAAKDKMRSDCRRQSDYEHDVLAAGLKGGRWTHFKKAGPYGLFECFRAIDGMNADYSLEGQCNDMHIEYCKRYTLTESKMEVRFYGNKAYSENIIDEYLKDTGRIMEIIDMGNHLLVYLKANEDASDIDLLLPIFDRLEADAD